MIRVRSSSFSLRSFSSTAPTLSSSAESIAANTRRWTFSMWRKRSKYSGVACIGLCTALYAKYKKNGRS
jgi:hypothetical protein